MTPRIYRQGDVISYRPDRVDRWCREGIAVAEVRQGQLVWVDTYWSIRDSSSHVLTTAERLTAEFLFHLGDYDELNRYPADSSRPTWLTYAPEDRAEITEQHGCYRRYFIRKGAEPHLPTQIANARDSVEQAERAVEAAQHTLEWRRRELANLEAQAVSA